MLGEKVRKWWVLIIRILSQSRKKSPVTPSSSLKLRKGLNKTSSMPENEVKSYDMSSVNSTPQNKTFKSTFGQPTESNAEPQNKTFKSTFDNHQHHRQNLKNNGI